MLAGLLMPKKRTATDGPRAKEKPKYTTPVKLTKQFKRRLQRVAKHEKMTMGELIEAKLGQFIDSTWLAILEVDQRQEDAEAKQIRESLRAGKG